MFADMLAVVSDHHEKLDGRGYPCGLSGGEMSLDTRIVTVAGLFKALTADRPYRRSLDPAAGMTVLDSLARTEIDPVCVSALKAAIQGDPSLARPAAPVAA